jgi:hypothetical protein
MGLISETIGFFVWFVTWPIRAVTGRQSNISQSTISLVEGSEETTDNVEESVDNGTSNALDPVEDSFDAMSEQVFEGVADPLRGFFNTLGSGLASAAGAPEAIRGLGEWIKSGFGQEWILGAIPKEARAVFEIIGTILIVPGNILAGLLNGAAGLFYNTGDFFGYLANLNGWEGLGFLLGLFLIVASAYVALTASFEVVGIPFTPYQVPVPVFGRTEDAFEGFTGMVLGAELLFWTMSNIAGAFLLLFTGMALIFWAIVQERGSLFIIGSPVLIIGSWLLLGAIKAGIIAMVIGTVAVYIGYRLLVERLEATGEEQIAQDRDLQLG